MTRKNKNISRILLYSFLAVIIYFLLYPILLPLSELTGSGKFMYAVYEPYEFIRCRNESIWSCSEAIYNVYGGKKKPQDRFFFKTPRRFIKYYPDGTKEIDAYFLGGKQNGLFESYGSHGKLLEKVHYKNGRLDGLGETWYSNGNKRSITHCKDDKTVGHDIKYYKNQKIERDINYNQDGKPDGEAVWYDPSGNLLAKGIYKNGSPWDGSFISYGIWLEFKNGVPGSAKRLKDNQVISLEEATESIKKSIKESYSIFYLEEDSI